MKMFGLKIMLAGVAAAALFAIAVAPLRAQLPMAEGPSAARSESEYDLEARIASMRYLISLAEKRGARRKIDPELALEQLQEDFTRIQILNKDLVLKTAKTNNPDLKFVGKSASEINKRADRLMSNLALPQLTQDDAPGPKLEAVSDLNKLKKSITALGWLIYRFTKNPMFKE